MAAPGHSFVPFAFPDQFYNSYLTILTFQCGIELHFQSSSQEKLMIQKWYSFKLMVGQPIPSTHGVVFPLSPVGTQSLKAAALVAVLPHSGSLNVDGSPNFPFSLSTFHYRRDGSFLLAQDKIFPCGSSAQEEGSTAREVLAIASGLYEGESDWQISQD